MDTTIILVVRVIAAVCMSISTWFAFVTFRSSKKYNNHLAWYEIFWLVAASLLFVVGMVGYSLTY